MRRRVRRLVYTYSVPAGGNVQDTIQVKDLEVALVKIENAGTNITASVTIEGVSGTQVDVKANFGYPATCDIQVDGSNAGTATESFDVAIYGTYVERR